MEKYMQLNYLKRDVLSNDLNKKENKEVMENEFKKSIKEIYHKKYNTNVELDWINFFHYTRYGINQFIESLVCEEESILILSPSHDICLNRSQRKIVTSCMIRDESGRFSIDINDMENKIKNNHCKMLFISNPQNPTGTVWKNEELKKIVTICKQYDMFLVSNDSLMYTTKENHKIIPIVHYLDNEWDKVIILRKLTEMNNVNCSYNLCFAIIPNYTIRNLFFLSLEDDFSYTILKLAEKEFINSELHYQQIDYLVYQLYCLNKLLHDCFPKIETYIPESGQMLWINIENIELTIEEFETYLFSKGVLGVLNCGMYDEKWKNDYRTDSSFLMIPNS